MKKSRRVVSGELLSNTEYFLLGFISIEEPKKLFSYGEIKVIRNRKGK